MKKKFHELLLRTAAKTLGVKPKKLRLDVSRVLDLDPETSQSWHVVWFFFFLFLFWFLFLLTLCFHQDSFYQKSISFVISLTKESVATNVMMTPQQLDQEPKNPLSWENPTKEWQEYIANNFPFLLTPPEILDFVSFEIKGESVM